jgi:hypothetical protein
MKIAANAVEELNQRNENSDTKKRKAYSIQKQD